PHGAVHVGRRTGSYQRRVECRAARSCPDGQGLCFRPNQKGDATSPEVLSTVQRLVHRDKPDSCQGRTGHDGPNRGRISTAARANEPEESGDVESDFEEVRLVEVNVLRVAYYVTRRLRSLSEYDPNNYYW